ncbi:hypothetical protein ACFC3Z_13425 [Enterococcus thailandicus]|uniref:hypothetical protein n=1 Tax=Enterococcus thailandicus TaxID=417368 RepID=UPI0035DAA7C7
MNRLEQAQNKLNRIRTEQQENAQAIRNEHDRIPFGQPNIIGRPDIYKNVKRKYEKNRKLIEQEEKQEHRVKMLERIDAFKNKNELLNDIHVVGKTEYATIGAKTSVNNLDYFKEQLKELEEYNEQAKAYNKTKPKTKMETVGVKITKLKKKIAYLENMQEQDNNKILSTRTSELIESGAVNQWKKKPIYYFVKGLRKVALEINENGNFYISSRYPTNTKSDKLFVENLLQQK